THNFKTPLEVFEGKISYTFPLKIFVCVCFIYRINVGKLDPKALKCIFVGYFSTQNRYKCYHIPSRKYFVSMDVTFREFEPYVQATLQGENQIKEVITNPNPICL